MIDHDRLFKELISTFFMEFLELFLPEIVGTIAPDSIQFLQQEYFVDLTSGEEKIIDLLVEVHQAGQEMAFLVHVEAQATSEANFTRRMFFYFARLYQKYLQRVYPIVVFSFDEPYRKEPHQHRMEFPTLKVLEFNFASIQLNRLNWQDFLLVSDTASRSGPNKVDLRVCGYLFALTPTGRTSVPSRGE